MKTKLLVSATLLAATLASASWAQVQTDAKARSTQSATPTIHLAVGTVASIDAAARTVTIDHQAIPSLNMQPMTMAFRLPASSKLSLKDGQSIAFTFTASADGLTIHAVQPVNALAGASADHSKMDHSMPGMQGMHGMKDMKGMMDSCHAMMSK